MEVSFKQQLDPKFPQIIFILGQPGSGKGTQCERLVRDYKFHHISIGDLMRAELKTNSADALVIKDLVAQGKLVPTEITVKLLKRALSQGKGRRYLIDGFPRELQQALVLERNFREIDFIINFDCPEDILVERLLERGKTSGRSDDNEETIKQRVSVFNEQTKPALELYGKLGRVVTINALGTIQEVYDQVKPAILPNIIFFFGAPVLGKSTVAQSLANRIHYTYVDLDAFYKHYKCSTSEKKINQLIDYFSNSPNRNFVVDSFFENQQQINMFFEHFTKPRYIFHFNATKDQVDNNIQNYVKCEKQKEQIRLKYQEFVKQRKEVLSVLNNQPFLVNINAIDCLEKIERNIVKVIQPQVFVAKTDKNEDLAEQFLHRLQEERGFIHLSIPWLIEKEIERQTKLGKQLKECQKNKQALDSHLQLELIRKIIFRQPHNDKYVLTGFPDSFDQFQLFNNNCCEISYLINFTQENQKLDFDYSNIHLTPEAYYFSQGKYIVIDQDAIELFDLFVEKRNRYGFVVGPSLSGKTLISKQLEANFGYTYIDWEVYQNDLKVKLGGEDGPREDLPYDLLLQELQKFLANQKAGNTVVFDGFPFDQNLQDQLNQMLGAIGEPTFVLGLNYQKEFAMKAYRKKKEMEAEAEFTEEDTEALDKIIKYGNEINQYFEDVAANSFGSNYYKINAELKWSDIVRSIDLIFQKRVITCDVYITGLKLEKCWKIYSELAANVCTKHNILFVDVKQLIQDEYNNSGPLKEQLRSQYLMRWTQTPENFPSNYTPNLIITLIKNHLQKFKFPPKDLLLFGYPSADNYKERSNEEQFFPRAIDEIKAIEQNLGPIRINFLITDDYIDYETNDAMQSTLKIDMPIIDKKPQEGEEAGGEEAQNAEEGGEEGQAKKKFNPAEYQWTVTDGNPKNLAQVYHNKNKPLQETYSFEKNDLSTFEHHLSQYLNYMNEGMNQNYCAQFINCFLE